MLGFRLVTLLGVLLATALAPSFVSALDLRSMQNSLEARYARAHSLGDNYQFNARDGWQTVNVTDLQYKYSRDYDDPDDPDDEDEEDTSVLDKRATKKKAKSSSKSKSKSKSKSTKSKSKSKSSSSKKKSSATSKVSKVASSFKKVIDTLKGIGKAEPVTITWYTGHDLENPSCWSNTDWAPSVCDMPLGSGQI